MNKHPNRGALYSEYLSTGCKTALNVVLASAKNNVCISPISIGEMLGMLCLRQGQETCYYVIQVLQGI